MVRWVRWAALAAVGAVALVVLWPVLAHPDVDGFPLSTYPMFSGRRTATEPLSTVVGIDRDGDEEWLDPWLVNGTREVVQAAVVVQAEIDGGQADRLCEEVAARVVAGGGRRVERLQRLEVVTVRYDAVRYFSDRRETPLERIVAATCPVAP